MRDISLGVRCISIDDYLGFETPSARAVLSNKNAVSCTLESLGKKKEQLVRKRAALAKNPKTSPEYLARYDEIIKNISGTLNGTTAKKCRMR